MSDALQDIALKLDRASEHIKQLDANIEAFLDETSNRVLTDYNPKSVEAFREFHRQRVVPPLLSLLAGEVIYQLRSSIDHLTCALVLTEGGTLTEFTQFPISRFRPDPTKKDEVARYERQIKGITRPEVLTIIESHQPYTRGNRRDFHWLAILKLLNNTDKHRNLNLQVVNVRMREYVRWQSPDGNITGEGVDNDADESADLPDPHSISGDGELVEIVHVDRSLTTQVAFAEFGPDRKYEVFDGLFQLGAAVHSVVKELGPFVSV